MCPPSDPCINIIMFYNIIPAVTWVDISVVSTKQSSSTLSVWSSFVSFSSHSSPGGFFLFSVVLIPRRESTEKLEDFVLRDEAIMVSSSFFFSLSSSTNLWIPKYVEPETIYFNLQECIFFKIVCFCPFIKKSRKRGSGQPVFGPNYCYSILSFFLNFYFIFIFILFFIFI